MLLLNSCFYEEGKETGHPFGMLIKRCMDLQQPENYHCDLYWDSMLFREPDIATSLKNGILWIVRKCGTNIIHLGTRELTFSIITKTFSDVVAIHLLKAKLKDGQNWGKLNLYSISEVEAETLDRECCTKA